MEAISCFFDYLASTHVVLSEPGLESFLKKSNEIGPFVKEQRCKRGVVAAKGVGVINMILAIL